MRRSALGFLALAVSGLSIAQVAVAGAEGSTPAKALTSVEKTFLIPSSDGYGVGDCLTTPGSECGQVVANAWCEAQGYAMAGSYGIAAIDEYTGAIEHPVATPTERPIRITCQD